MSFQRLRLVYWAEYNSPFIAYSYDPQVVISFISTTIQLLIVPTIGYLIYTAAFGSFNIGVAAAESIGLFVVIVIVSVFQFRFFSAETEY